MGVPHFTFFAAMGIVLERGWHHHKVFDLVRPGFDRAAAIAERQAAGYRYGFELSDFYPDAIPCLRALKAAGLKVGLAGNQPAEAESALAGIGLPVDFIASSAGWGVEKPSPEFFARTADAACLPPDQIAYVGDRLDNDVLPAATFGMAAVFLRRGPWGLAHADDPRLSAARLRLDSLETLPSLILQL
jgi:HAD superfamily hydrolase (TIGR01549 family)